MIPVIAFLILMVINYCLAGPYATLIRFLIDENEEILWILAVVMSSIIQIVAFVGIKYLLIATLAGGLISVGYLMVCLLAIGVFVNRVMTVYGTDKLKEKLS